MSIMDKLRKQLGQHGDKVDKGVDKAADAADKRTQGKYREHLRSGAEQAKKASRRYADKGKGARRQSGQPGASPRDEGPT